jgi:hypothetical protein
MFNKTFRFLGCCAGLALAAAMPARAVPLSFSGAFTRDDDVRLFSFVTTGATTVTIETFGYAGGTDPLGHVSAGGGFDPVFALFTGAGTLLGYGDDGATRTDAVTGAAFDALLTTPLAAGRYFVALSQYDNFANGPSYSDGFLRAGQPTFTAANGCAAGRFCDINGFGRTGYYEIAISGAAVAAVPEPGKLAFVVSGVPLLLWLARRRRPA